MISKKILEQAIRMIHVASEDATRPSINCVMINSEVSGTVVLCATNGHCLSEYTFASKVECPNGKFMLKHANVSLIKSILKAHKFSESIEASINGVNALRIGSQNGDQCVLDGSACFPEYKGIFPVIDSAVSISLDARYIADIAKAIDFKDKKAQHITFTFDASNNLKPIKVSGSEDSYEGTSLSLIMPVRTDAATDSAERYSRLMTLSSAGVA